MQKLNLIIKAETVGVVQAIKAALSALPQESVTLRYLLSGAGDINTSDVDLAAASDALLLGFNLEPSADVAVHAKRAGVSIMTYKVWSGVDVCMHACVDVCVHACMRACVRACVRAFVERG
eukprot:354904-Chlamydomonas_euryale.AAC.1